MARQTTSLEARLRKLEAAKARAAAHGSKVALRSKPMAELLGVTWNVLRDWCNELAGFEESGAFVRGGLGHEWEFKPRKTVAFLIAHFNRQAAREAAKSKAIGKATGAEVLLGESLTDTRHAYELARSIKREKRIDGEHVRRDHVQWLFGTSMERTRSRVMSVVTKADPNGNFPPAQRERVEAACRAVLLELYEDNVELKEEFDVRVQQERSV